MDIKPFKFKLKKVDPKKQRAFDALLEFLPRTGIREKVHEAVKESLSKHLNINVEYRLEAANEISFENFCGKVSDPAVVVTLSMMPRESRILVDIDSSLAGFFIEKLLGGNPENLPAPRELSDVEQGVLQYLIVQLLAGVYKFSGKDSRVNFKFDKFAFRARDIKGLMPENETLFVVIIKVMLGKCNGFVRMAFPSLLVEAEYLKVPLKGEIRAGDREYLFEQLNRFQHVRFPIWGDGGHIVLTGAELSGLEEGDVIVFDESRLKLEDEKLGGEAVLRAGNGKHGGFVSEIKAEDKKIKCKIVGSVKGEDIF